MFVNDIGVLHPYNNEKIMQIHDNRLIAECTSYDFKEMLERKESEVVAQIRVGFRQYGWWQLVLWRKR